VTTRRRIDGGVSATHGSSAAMAGDGTQTPTGAPASTVSTWNAFAMSTGPAAVPAGSGR
jgi:hypothetical protein